MSVTAVPAPSLAGRPAAPAWQERFQLDHGGHLGPSSLALGSLRFEYIFSFICTEAASASLSHWVQFHSPHPARPKASSLAHCDLQLMVQGQERPSSPGHSGTKVKGCLCPHCSLRPPCPLFSGPISHSGFFSRLKQLDKHGQATAQQLVQLLNKQNQLLQERQSLSEEVGRLRAQVPCRVGLPAREHAGVRGVFSCVLPG